MPPANTGSKGALVTWTVVATVFGITCMVLAIVAYSGQQDAENRRQADLARYQQIAAEADITGSAVASLRDQKTAANSNQLDLPFAINQAVSTAQLATGNGDPQAAQTQMQQTIESINQTIASGEGAVAGNASTLAQAADNAVGEVTRLRGELDRLTRQLAQQQRTGDEAQQALRDQVQQTEQRVQAAQEQLSAAVAASEQAQQTLTDIANKYQQQIQAFGAQAGEQTAELSQQLADAQAEAERLSGQLGQATAAMASGIDTNAMTTEADGRIIRSPNQGRLTINLGRRDNVSRGMTFAVYDSTTGIPRLSGDAGDLANVNLPRGKASIEIVSLGDTSSEARIIREQAGTSVREGDLIANLAYDRNSPRRFYVFGNFDFNGDGQANTGEGEQIKGLIREFGGTLVNGVTVDTDVVVLGRQPVVPDLPTGRSPTVVELNNIQQAEQDLATYQRIRDEAAQLNKTIINQNQLLSLIGYYELARM